MFSVRPFLAHFIYDVSVWNRKRTLAVTPSSVAKSKRKIEDSIAIDDVFRAMPTDKQFRKEALRLATQFLASDAEAIEIGSRDLTGG
jgi:hypothetical protein